MAKLSFSWLTSEACRKMELAFFATSQKVLVHSQLKYIQMSFAKNKNVSNVLADIMSAAFVKPSLRTKKTIVNILNNLNDKH